MLKLPEYKRYLFIIILLSLLIRSVFAFLLELNNDEVNYWTYALYPSLSYFDHPPMVGWLIRLTTFNLIFTNEFFIRLSSIIFGALNTWIIYKIGGLIKNEITGFYSALLYNASLYGFLISGIFILPDTPQLLFWLLSTYCFLKSIFHIKINISSKKNILLSGIFVGLAMISKYHSILLWIGALFYIVIYNRKWLKIKELYISLLFSVLIFMPVIIWNFQNDFISFLFQCERVNILKMGLRLDNFFIELGGEILYNNPMVFVLSAITIINIKNLKLINDDFKKLLLFFSLPNILIFLFLSLFNKKTLPHWAGPGYITLIILTASYISQKNHKNILKIPISILSAFILLFLILASGYFTINYSVFSLITDSRVSSTELGRNDLTLDMYGWRQIQEKFKKLNDKYIIENVLSSEAPIISNKWYNAGHADYYLGGILNKKIYCAGNLNDIRNYYFVNRHRGDLQKGSDAYYISPSRDFKNPDELLRNNFEKIEALDTIRVTRSGKIVENIFLYKLEKYNGTSLYFK